MVIAIPFRGPGSVRDKPAKVDAGVVADEGARAAAPTGAPGANRCAVVSPPSRVAAARGGRRRGHGPLKELLQTMDTVMGEVPGPRPERRVSGVISATEHAAELTLLTQQMTRIFTKRLQQLAARHHAIHGVPPPASNTRHTEPTALALPLVDPTAPPNVPRPLDTLNVTTGLGGGVDATLQRLVPGGFVGGRPLDSRGGRRPSIDPTGMTLSAYHEALAASLGQGARRTPAGAADVEKGDPPRPVTWGQGKKLQRSAGWGLLSPHADGESPRQALSPHPPSQAPQERQLALTYPPVRPVAPVETPPIAARSKPRPEDLRAAVPAPGMASIAELSEQLAQLSDLLHRGGAQSTWQRRAPRGRKEAGAAPSPAARHGHGVEDAPLEPVAPDAPRPRPPAAAAKDARAARCSRGGSPLKHLRQYSDRHRSDDGALGTCILRDALDAVEEAPPSPRRRGTGLTSTDAAHVLLAIFGDGEFLAPFRGSPVSACPVSTPPSARADGRVSPVSPLPQALRLLGDGGSGGGGGGELTAPSPAAELSSLGSLSRDTPSGTSRDTSPARTHLTPPDATAISQGHTPTSQSLPQLRPGVPTVTAALPNASTTSPPSVSPRTVSPPPGDPGDLAVCSALTSPVPAPRATSPVQLPHTSPTPEPTPIATDSFVTTTGTATATEETPLLVAVASPQLTGVGRRPSAMLNKREAGQRGQRTPMFQAGGDEGGASPVVSLGKAALRRKGSGDGSQDSGKRPIASRESARGLRQRQPAKARDATAGSTSLPRAASRRSSIDSRSSPRGKRRSSAVSKQQAASSAPSTPRSEAFLQAVAMEAELDGGGARGPPRNTSAPRLSFVSGAGKRKKRLKASGILRAFQETLKEEEEQRARAERLPDADAEAGRRGSNAPAEDGEDNDTESNSRRSEQKGPQDELLDEAIGLCRVLEEGRGPYAKQAKRLANRLKRMTLQKRDFDQRLAKLRAKADAETALQAPVGGAEAGAGAVDGEALRMSPAEGMGRGTLGMRDGGKKKKSFMKESFMGLPEGAVSPESRGRNPRRHRPGPAMGEEGGLVREHSLLRSPDSTGMHAPRSPRGVSPRHSPRNRSPAGAKSPQSKVLLNVVHASFRGDMRPKRGKLVRMGGFGDGIRDAESVQIPGVSEAEFTPSMYAAFTVKYETIGVADALNNMETEVGAFVARLKFQHLTTEGDDDSPVLQEARRRAASQYVLATDPVQVQARYDKIGRDYGELRAGLEAGVAVLKSLESKLTANIVKDDKDRASSMQEDYFQFMCQHMDGMPKSPTRRRKHFQRHAPNLTFDARDSVVICEYGQWIEGIVTSVDGYGHVVVETGHEELGSHKTRAFPGGAAHILKVPFRTAVLIEDTVSYNLHLLTTIRNALNEVEKLGLTALVKSTEQEVRGCLAEAMDTVRGEYATRSKVFTMRQVSMEFQRNSAQKHCAMLKEEEHQLTDDVMLTTEKYAATSRELQALTQKVKRVKQASTSKAALLLHLHKIVADEQRVYQLIGFADVGTQKDDSNELVEYLTNKREALQEEMYALNSCITDLHDYYAQLEAEVACPRCFLVTPNIVSLACGHSFCEFCVKRMCYEEGNVETWVCKQCQKFSVTPPMPNQHLAALSSKWLVGEAGHRDLAAAIDTFKAEMDDLNSSLPPELAMHLNPPEEGSQGDEPPEDEFKGGWRDSLWGDWLQLKEENTPTEPALRRGRRHAGV